MLQEEGASQSAALCSSLEGRAQQPSGPRKDLQALQVPGDMQGRDGSPIGPRKDLQALQGQGDVEAFTIYSATRDRPTLDLR